ncbi:MAG: NHL repeat-containing protein [Planctomycetota bacterium]
MANWIWGIGVGLLLALPAAAQTAATDAIEGRFGELVAQVEGLDGPVDAAFGEDGTLFVLERNPGRLRVFDADGAELGSVSSTSGARAQALLHATATSVQRSGVNLRVGYREPGVRTDAIDPATLLWRGAEAPKAGGTRAFVDGTSAGQPGSWAHLSSTERAIRWSAADTPEGRSGTLETPAAWPTDLALIGDDRLAIVDAGSHELFVVGADGDVHVCTGGFGHFPGQLSAPGGVDVHGERIYVADTQNHRIQVFSLDGDLLYEWGKHAYLPRQGRGHLHYPSDVAISPNGSRAVVLEPFENRIQIFGPAAGPASQYRTDPATLGAEPTGHFGPPIAAHGRYAVTIEPETQQVHVQDLNTQSGAPVLVGRAGGYGAGPGRFRGLVDVAFASNGESVWVLDQMDAELAEFALVRDADDQGPRFRRDRLEFVRSFDLRTLDERVVAPSLLAVADGRLVVFDLLGGGVLEFGDRMKQRTWIPSTDPELLWGLGEPMDLRIDPSGDLLAAFERGWVPLTDPDAEPRTAPLGGLAVDAEGGLWWTDRANHRLVGPDGPIGSGPGLGRLEFTDPRGVALTGDGRVVVVDHGNHRLQVLSVAGEYRGVAGPRGYVMPALRPAPADESDEEQD